LIGTLNANGTMNGLSVFEDGPLIVNSVEWTATKL
jgi:hypothetical protein